MFKQNVLLIILGVISLTLFSCSNNPTAIGSDFVSSDLINVKTLDSYADSLKQTSSYFKQPIPLWASSYLFLGKKNNATASFLLKFLVSLPDSVNNDLKSNAAQVVSSIVTLPGGYVYGDSTANLDFNAYKITSPWTSTNFTSDNLGTLTYDPTDVSSNRNISANDSLTIFNVSNSLTTTWLVAAADSVDSTIYGIYVVPTSNSQKILGYTTSTANVPEINLQVVIQKTGAYSDTVTFYPEQYTSAVKGNLPAVSNEDIVVQAGVEINSKLWFDVSKIPVNSVINHADLILSPDSTYQLFGNTFYNSIMASSLKDSSSAVIDSSSYNFYNQVLSLTNGQYVGNIASIVQNWVSTKSNQGLLLEANGNLLGLELFALKGSRASNLQLRPRLRITYSLRK